MVSSGLDRRSGAVRWVDREAKLGRTYACGSQSIGGFPIRIVIRCDKAAATFSSNHPPFDVTATGVTFSAALYRPTLLHGEIDGPVTVADPGNRRSSLPIGRGRNWTCSDCRRTPKGFHTSHQAAA